MDGLIDLVLQVLGGVLVSLLIGLVVKLFQRVGLSVNAEREAQIREVATKVVLKVEEVTAAQLKAGLADKVPGAQKLQMAVTELLDRVPRIDRDEAEAIVKAVLPGLGLGATELGKALRTK